MIRKKAIIQINNDSLSYKEVLRKSFIDRLITSKKHTELNLKFNSIEDIKIDFTNKNLFIVIDGEEVYVKLLTLPKVKKERLYEIIKSELQYRFKTINNIMFTYEILKDNGVNLEVAVFCLNWNKSELIKKCMGRGAKVKGIYPIQFCILNKYKNYIEDKKYIFIFVYEDILYFLACINSKIVANSVIKTFKEKSFMEELNKFQIKCGTIEEFKDINKIFFLDFPNKRLIEDVKKLCNCIDLGSIDKEAIQAI
jgi:hypothetical protein